MLDGKQNWFNLKTPNSSAPRTSKMGKKRVLVSYGVDVDAVAGWLGSYGGEDSSNDISRGENQAQTAISPSAPHL